MTFNRAVDVDESGGTPRLALTIGTGTRQAAYASGTGTKRLSFTYEVAAGDSAPSGVAVAAGALILNGGAINDARDATAAASRSLGSHAITASASHRVDGSLGPPGVSDVSLNSPAVGDTYERGETIEVTVTFNKSVAVTGAPQLGLRIGSATRQADYASGAGTTALVFRYTVQTADVDTGGISVAADALTLNGGTIRLLGSSTVGAVLGLGSEAVPDSVSHKVAGGTFTAAAVSGASITSTPAGASTYGRGEAVEVTVTFSRRVAVDESGGTPQLALTLTSGAVQAAYASGASTATALVFRYTVRTADEDTDGIEVGASALTLNGGAINDARATTPRVAAGRGLGSHAIGASTAHKVDGSLGPPGVEGVAVGAPDVGDTFERGETIEVTVTFHRSVDVGGTPRLALGIGTRTRQASYASGTGTTALVFRYEVASNDADPNGISIAAGALTLNGGTIRLAGSTAVDAALDLGANAIEDRGSRKVAGGTFTAASVSGVSVTSSPSSGMTYGLGETIEVQVTFSRPVTVTGAPRLELTIGTAARQTLYAAGSSTATVLEFRYTVEAGDTDPDGIGVAAGALGLNGGRIDDARGRTAASRSLGVHAITAASSHRVNGLQGPPGVLSVQVTPPPSGGTPRLALNIGTETRQAVYASGSSTATVLEFHYTVAVGDADPNGLGVAADALDLNGGAIHDARDAAAAARLGLGRHAFSNAASHKVDFTLGPPGVAGVALNPPVVGDTYEPGDAIEATVTFTRNMDVDVSGGTPQLGLGIAAATRQTAYASGSGTRALVFSYTAAAGETDADGVSVAANAIGLNGGTIKVSGGTLDALLDLGANAIGNSPGHKVAGTRTASAVNGVSLTSRPASGAAYGLAERVEATVTFTRSVVVDVSGGTPRLALGVGTETRQAAYASGTGTAQLVFRYEVALGDEDPDGVSIAAGALGLNGGAIADARSGVGAASLALGTHAITDASGHRVDSRLGPAGVSAVTVGSAFVGDTFERGETIEATVTFNKAVTVTGTPRLALTLASGVVQADYASGAGTASLVFRYTVASGDVDANGLGIAADALTLNGGTIRSPGGTVDALLDLGARAITDSGSHKVAGGTFTAAAVNGAAIVSTPANGATFGMGELIEVEVGFDRPVTVTGSPQLELSIGGETRLADYVPGAGADRQVRLVRRSGEAPAAARAVGTRTLGFRYRVAPSDADSDGISVGANALVLNSGTITDARDADALADLVLGANAIMNSGAHLADGTLQVPVVSAVTVVSRPGSGDTYARGEPITVRVEFSLAVSVTGAPRLSLTLGGASAAADYVR